MVRRLTVGSMICLMMLAGSVAADLRPDDPPVRVHANAGALRRATIRASDALLRDDRERIVEALAAMKRSTPALPVEAEEQFGAVIRGFDVAFHRALDRSREDAAVGTLDDVFDDLFWVRRTCRQCHAQARERDLLPAKGPLWKDDETPFAP